MYVFDNVRKERHRVVIRRITAIEGIVEHDFSFDWTVESDFEVYGLITFDESHLLGLISIHCVFDELRLDIRLLELAKGNIAADKRFARVAGILIAHACRLSFELGFFGFVSLVPKTQLIDHYRQEEYGFVQYGRMMAVELERSEQIMRKYLSDE